MSLLTVYLLYRIVLFLVGLLFSLRQNNKETKDINIKKKVKIKPKIEVKTDNKKPENDGWRFENGNAFAFYNCDKIKTEELQIDTKGKRSVN